MVCAHISAATGVSSIDSAAEVLGESIADESDLGEEEEEGEEEDGACGSIGLTRSLNHLNPLRIFLSPFVTSQM